VRGVEAVRAPYGAWPSPITAAAATAGMSGGRIASAAYPEIVGEEVWWVEPRPGEGGRTALVRGRADGSTREVLPAPWDVRSRVIEYGGRPWAAVAGGPGEQGERDERGERGRSERGRSERGRSGQEGPDEQDVLVVFTHLPDQRLYVWRSGARGGPRPLTPLSAVGGGLRWAEPEIDLKRREIRCVLEEFTGEGPLDVRRVIAAVPLDGSAAEDRSAVRELSDGERRFLCGPRLSPDGSRAVWLAWDHPYMPWDAAEVRIAEVDEDGALLDARTLAGGPGDPVAQAEWAADGSLLAAREGTGWWNLYRVDTGTGEMAALHAGEEEFAGAQRLGLRWFMPLPDGRVATLHGLGAQRLALLDPATGELTDVPGERSEWLPHLAVSGSRVAGVAGSPQAPYRVLEHDTATGRTRVLGGRGGEATDARFVPRPFTRVFAGPAGRQVHAQVYPPRNPGRGGPEGELPPYVVWVHGGPVGRASLALNLEIAYFTSRGLGVVEVNHGGSVGYGRAYRERLYGQWGVAEVEDCAAVARALVREGLASPGGIAIRGVSAGGFTAAASLVATDVYACATLQCPLLDLHDFASGPTHDFESHFVETLLGGSPAQVPERYRDRSPAAHPERVTAPFVLLQGAEDPICPPASGERFVERIAGRGVPHAFVTFEGEGHGFRRQETMTACLEAELSLYGQVFGFTPPGVPTLELRG
jgi:dipeptidyl aminopeptidase/acylaminoacyl peptidase